MLVANAVVDTDQPRLQVGENQMDDRQVLLGNLWITTLGNSEVLIAALTSPLKKASLTGFHATAKHIVAKAVSPSSETMRTI